MADSQSSKDTARLLYHLQRSKQGRLAKPAVSLEQALSSAMALLRTWQAERLAITYAAYLANPRYQPAAAFFLSDIYAPRDFSQRNLDIEHVYRSMHKLLPERMLRPLGLVVELHYLTEELDQRLLNILVNRLGVSNSITAAQYAEAYRLCDNYDDRLRQIELLIELGEGVERLVRTPFTAITLRLARGPARLAGWHELQDFLERGFNAFKAMDGAAEFLATVKQRETLILERIYNNHAHPFDLNDAGEPIPNP